MVVLVFLCSALLSAQSNVQYASASSGTIASPFTSLADAYNAPSNGRYYFNLGSGLFQADVDTSEGGGWVLILQYSHQGGTDPALNVIGAAADLPIASTPSLGTNQSGDLTRWGHAGNAAMSQFTDADELRFYSITNLNSRVIHFYTSTGISYAKTGAGSFTGVGGNFTSLTGHSAFLPAATTEYFTNQGNYALTNFPFWVAATYHWGVGGDGGRWESDDYPNNNSANTLHKVWVRAQDVRSPGGVNDNLSLWAKADGASTSGSTVTGWLDQSKNNTFSVVGSPSLNQVGLNFNPTVLFDGNSRFVSNTATSSVTEAFAVAKINNPTGTAASGAVIGNSAQVSGDYFFHTEGGLLYAGNSGAYISTNSFGNNVPFSIMNADLSETPAGNNQLRVNGLAYTNNAGGDPVPFSRTLTLGSRASENFINGSEIAEAIVYADSKASGMQRAQILSYLALKYGITLNAAVGDYRATDGSSVFQFTGGYTNHVVGLARDDTSLLHQRVSKSISDGSIVTVATDADFTSANTDSRSSLGDGQYLVLGSNGGSLSAQTSELDIVNYKERIGREWRAENTGSVGAINVKFDSFDDTYYLLADSDGDFSSGATSLGQLSADGEIAITINDDTYYTLATLQEPSFSVSKTTASVAENGGTDTFTVVLDTPIAGSVQVDISSSDTDEATVSPGSLTFASDDWDTPQTVTIVGVQDDHLGDDSATITANINDAASDDNYDPLADQIVSIILVNDDVASISPSVSNLALAEGDTGQFSVVLAAQPDSDVVVSVASEDSLYATADVASLTFTDANWDTPQTVTVTGVHDANNIDNNTNINLSVNNAASDDAFDDLQAVVAIAIEDDDMPAIVYTSGTGSVSESGTVAAVGVMLSTEPDSSVVVNFENSDSTEISLSTTSLTFTAANWNVSQTLNITGVDDSIIDGNQSTAVLVTVVSSATGYSILDPIDLVIITTDNDADSDDDGVFDAVDECPLSPPGVSVAANGCPPAPIPSPAPVVVAPRSPNNSVVDQQPTAQNAPDVEESSNDSDGDGVLDGVEDGGLNDGDMNADGIKDRLQTNVTTIDNPQTNAKISLDTTASETTCTIETFEIKLEANLANQDNDTDYPVGLHDFTVVCDNAGDIANIKVIYDKQYDATGWQYKKYDAESGTYVDISASVVFGTLRIGGVSVTTAQYKIADGGALDADKAVNGTVVDPAGPGVNVASSEQSVVSAHGGGFPWAIVSGLCLLFVTLMVYFYRKTRMPDSHVV